jgi:hypothetical protein
MQAGQVRRDAWDGVNETGRAQDKRRHGPKQAALSGSATRCNRPHARAPGGRPAAHTRRRKASLHARQRSHPAHKGAWLGSMPCSSLGERHSGGRSGAATRIRPHGEAFGAVAATPALTASDAASPLARLSSSQPPTRSARRWARVMPTIPRPRCRPPRRAAARRRPRPPRPAPPQATQIAGRQPQRWGRRGRRCGLRRTQPPLPWRPLSASRRINGRGRRLHEVRGGAHRKAMGGPRRRGLRRH